MNDTALAEQLVAFKLNGEDVQALPGETLIEVRCAATTVKEVESVRAPTIAVMVVVPAANIEASPVLSMVATAVEDEVHRTPLVRSAEDPSL